MRPRAAVTSYGYSSNVSHSILVIASPSHATHIHHNTTHEHANRPETVVNICLVCLHLKKTLSLPQQLFLALGSRWKARTHLWMKWLRH
ncbi:hypothetical protein GGR57DRAFT_484539 [Xylariaceae sp. FL1272]|nr:hypothetical protein GGR57DRAFT_484539 [Xylariaceae sp. FL1272]